MSHNRYIHGIKPIGGIMEKLETNLPILGRPLRWVVLTGAGISAESGIDTFRTKDGLWEKYRIEDVAVPSAWRENRGFVWSFYQQRRKKLLEVEPNPSHYALAELERVVVSQFGVEKELTPTVHNLKFGDSERQHAGFSDDWEAVWRKNNGDGFLLVTQNIDDLHQRAGSSNIIPMHGQLRIIRCERCFEMLHTMEERDLDTELLIPCPTCASDIKENIPHLQAKENMIAVMRPHVVWFHEMPLGLETIYDSLEKADVLLIVGTSGNVVPAAGFVDYFRGNGGYVIGVNLDMPENGYLFDEFHQGKSGELLPILLNEWRRQLLIG